MTRLLSLFVLLLACLACIPTTVKAAVPTVRILPLGDSITEGCCLSVGGAYRTELYRLLTEAGYNLDFLGSLQDLVPPPLLPDIDHEGHDGYRIDEIDAGLESWTSVTDSPDIVLVHLGTNDEASNYDIVHAPNRLETLLDHVAALHPHAKIIVANLILAANPTIEDRIQTTFNPFVPGVVAAQVAQGRDVYFTDMHSCCGIFDLSDQVNGLHPNAAGYAKMATNWFGAITNVIGPLGTTDPPAILRIGGWVDLNHVVVTFTKPIADSAVSLSNFALSGGVHVWEATLDNSLRSITLTTSPQMPSTLYTVTVNNIQDRISPPNTIAPDATASFQSGAVAEAVNYRLVYSLRLPNQADYNLGGVPYDIDDHASVGRFSRVAYYLELEQSGGTPDFLWVSMDAFTQDASKIGVPTIQTGAFFQQVVADMNVRSSVAGIVTGDGLTGGNIEFWWGDSSPSNGVSVLGASGALYDFGDSASPEDPPGYGSMQVHNPAASQTLFAFNGWGSSSISDLGIGNNPAQNQNPDWTFAANAGKYSLKTLQVYVLPERTLTVNSLHPGGAVTVAVNPTDLASQADGTTTFTRSYANGTIVNLSAPATAVGHVFQKWLTNGMDYATTASTTLAINTNYTLTAVYVSRVLGRYIFYNNSAWDGNSSAANSSDDNAIAPDKSALLPGGVATFANYTSYSLGINGIMIDVALPRPVPTLSATGDFTFRVGNSEDPDTWAAPSDLPAISVRPGTGLSGSDRVTLIWPDGSIKKQWLQVTVLPTDNTGLTRQDVFYFGNAIGECGNTAGTTTPDAVVNGADVVYTRSNLRGPFNPAPITFPYDYNRDKVVNGADIIISRVNLAGPFSALKLITAP